MKPITGTMKSALMALGIGITLFAIAEVLASFLSWRGAPTDTTWEPSFWKYEAWRLSYWLPLSIVAAAFSFAATFTFSRYPADIQRYFPSGAVTAAGLFCISEFGAEYTTSVRFWDSLPKNEATLLWISERLYIREHCESWFISTALLLLAWLWWHRQSGRRTTAGSPTARTTVVKSHSAHRCNKELRPSNPPYLQCTVKRHLPQHQRFLASA